MIKNPAIPIKFIYNMVGPVTFEPKHSWCTKIYKDSLENNEPEEIDKAKTNDKLISMNSTPHPLTKNSDQISMMNLSIRRKFNTNFDEILSDLGKGEVDENSLKYLELLDKEKYSFSITYIDNKIIPTLCIYGGQDEYIVVAYYALLKKTFL